MVKRSLTASQKTYNAEATQAAILDAAEAEFAKHGLAAANTEAIATSSGVTKTMIYYYFENKEGLYLAVLKRAFLERLSSIEAMGLEQLLPEQALERFLQWFLSEISHNPNLPAILFYEALQNQGKYYKQINMLSIYVTLSTILERGIASGVFRPLEPKHAAVNMVGMCVFYFCARENIKHLWPDKRLLSKEMLLLHTWETIAQCLASVRSIALLNHS